MQDLLSGSFSFTRLDKQGDVAEVQMEAGLGSPGTDLAPFNAEVEEIRTDIKACFNDVGALRSLHEEKKSTSQPAQVQRLTDEMGSTVRAISKAAKAIKVRIGELKKSNLTNRRYPGCEKDTATDRHRTNVTMSLAVKLKEVVDAFVELRGRIDRDHREEVRRQVFTFTQQKVGEEELDRIVESGSEEVIRAAIQMQGSAEQQQLADLITDIEQRHSAVNDISKQLMELNQMFLDMAVLVESQQETLDQIEEQVGKAHAFVGDGTKVLVEARKTQLDTRKWICIGTIAAIVILLIIIVPIVISASKK